MDVFLFLQNLATTEPNSEAAEKMVERVWMEHSIARCIVHNYDYVDEHPDYSVRARESYLDGMEHRLIVNLTSKKSVWFGVHEKTHGVFTLDVHNMPIEKIHDVFLIALSGQQMATWENQAKKVTLDSIVKMMDRRVNYGDDYFEDGE